jgi:hypothetical protein
VKTEELAAFATSSPGTTPTLAKLNDADREQLLARSHAAMRVIADLEHPAERWDLLLAVVAPSDAYTAAQARARREAA